MLGDDATVEAIDPSKEFVQTMLRIAYQSEDFPAGTIGNGSAELSVTWDDILWAAVTVGRPNRSYVFKHGAASRYEALFRWSMIRMALEQSSPGGYRLRRTEAAKTLDPSEKGAVNYFLGMVFCKLFASKLLDTPWLLHLDVFRPSLNAVLTGRSRPDLVGATSSGTNWHAFECKGRISSPDATVKSKAKSQAQRLVSVNSTACSLHIGAVAYFKGDTLQFYWRDPPAQTSKSIEVQTDSETWRSYYAPVMEVISDDSAPGTVSDLNSLAEVPDADVKVGLHPSVRQHAIRGDWVQVRQALAEAGELLRLDGYQADGVKVVAGSSWKRRFADPGRE